MKSKESRLRKAVNEGLIRNDRLSAKQARESRVCPCVSRPINVNTGKTCKHVRLSTFLRRQDCRIDWHTSRRLYIRRSCVGVTFDATIHRQGEEQGGSLSHAKVTARNHPMLFRVD